MSPFLLRLTKKYKNKKEKKKKMFFFFNFPEFHFFSN